MLRHGNVQQSVKEEERERRASDPTLTCRRKSREEKCKWSTWYKSGRPHFPANTQGVLKIYMRINWQRFIGGFPTGVQVGTLGIVKKYKASTWLDREYIPSRYTTLLSALATDVTRLTEVRHYSACNGFLRTKDPCSMFQLDASSVYIDFLRAKDLRDRFQSQGSSAYNSFLRTQDAGYIVSVYTTVRMVQRVLAAIRDSSVGHSFFPLRTYVASGNGAYTLSSEAKPSEALRVRINENDTVPRPVVSILQLRPTASRGLCTLIHAYLSQAICAYARESSASVFTGYSFRCVRQRRRDTHVGTCECKKVSSVCRFHSSHSFTCDHPCPKTFADASRLYLLVQPTAQLYVCPADVEMHVHEKESNIREAGMLIYR
ncbi:unnamed protein product [Rangifer tarandus platyrhynchus]|uniref:Uncharacterized protein n=1 Tax=Rangifer tarandus platyrhynchus TaxID=3082113 RepID=A0ABN8XL23_RANTA|nr:unnamed protein product [Rangifer tarandus platyrhynchus]